MQSPLVPRVRYPAPLPAREFPLAVKRPDHVVEVIGGNVVVTLPPPPGRRAAGVVVRGIPAIRRVVPVNVVDRVDPTIRRR